MLSQKDAFDLQNDSKNIDLCPWAGMRTGRMCSCVLGPRMRFKSLRYWVRWPKDNHPHRSSSLAVSLFSVPLTQTRVFTLCLASMTDHALILSAVSGCE